MKARILSWVVLLAALAGAQAHAKTGLDIEHWQLDNGARVYFVATDAIPTVDVRVTLDAAGARDGDLAGLARLTNLLLDQGADGMDAQTIALAFEDVGARYSAGSERDMAWVGLRALSRPDALDPALDMLGRVIAQPDFPAADFERERRRMQVVLQHERQSPGALASRAFYGALYDGHPYGSAPQGDDESLEAIERDDVAAFHREYYVGANAVVAIVGDLDRAQAEHVAQQVVGALPAGERPAPLPEPAPPEAQHIHVPFPANQTTILVGMPGITRDDPQHETLHVGNHVLGGGGLVSLLTSEMRDRRGLSYSTYSYFVPMAQTGPFIMGSQVRADRTEETLEVLTRLFERYREEGPTATQLRAAQQNITGGFPLQLDSNRKIVGQISAIGYYGLPLDYLDEYTQRIDAIEREQIRAAFQRIDPRRQVVVTVGPEPEQE